MAAQRRQRLAAIRARVKRTWSELGYANRRMFDIRTGQRFIAGEKDSPARAVQRRALPTH